VSGRPGTGRRDARPCVSTGAGRGQGPAGDRGRPPCVSSGTEWLPKRLRTPGYRTAALNSVRRAPELGIQAGVRSPDIHRSDFSAEFQSPGTRCIDCSAAVNPPGTGESTSALKPSFRCTAGRPQRWIPEKGPQERRQPCKTVPSGPDPPPRVDGSDDPGLRPGIHSQPAHTPGRRPPQCGAFARAFRSRTASRHTFRVHALSFHGRSAPLERIGLPVQIGVLCCLS